MLFWFGLGVVLWWFWFFVLFWGWLCYSGLVCLCWIVCTSYCCLLLVLGVCCLIWLGCFSFVFCVTCLFIVGLEICLGVRSLEWLCLLLFGFGFLIYCNSVAYDMCWLVFKLWLFGVLPFAYLVWLVFEFCCCLFIYVGLWFVYCGAVINFDVVDCD